MTQLRAVPGIAIATAVLALCFAPCVPAQSPPAMPPGGAAPPALNLQLPSNTPSSPSPPPSAACNDCGIITSIRQTMSKDTWTPLGMGVAVGGAPNVGGAPGVGDQAAAVTAYQIGPGFSNQGMVLLGAAGGAQYRKAPNSYERPRWEVAIKLDNGGVRVVTLAYEPYVREGDHVRVSGNSVELV